MPDTYQWGNPDLKPDSWSHEPIKSFETWLSEAGLSMHHRTQNRNSVSQNLDKGVAHHHKTTNASTSAEHGWPITAKLFLTIDVLTAALSTDEFEALASIAQGHISSLEPQQILNRLEVEHPTHMVELYTAYAKFASGEANRLRKTQAALMRRQKCCRGPYHLAKLCQMIEECQRNIESSDDRARKHRIYAHATAIEAYDALRTVLAKSFGPRESVQENVGRDELADLKADLQTKKLLD